MKKIIYSAVLFLSIGIVIVACQKENTTDTASSKSANEVQLTPSEEGLVSDKNRQNITDDYLIRAINAQDDTYIDLGELQELLVENSPLSQTVLIQLINHRRIPNELVELAAIISGPVANNIVELIGKKRPNLDRREILLNQNKNAAKEIKVIFTQPISVIMGNELQHTKLNPDCDDCSSVITGSPDTRLVQLREREDVYKPIRAKCDSKKYECGQAISVKKENGREGAPTYTLHCDKRYDQVCINGKAVQ